MLYPKEQTKDETSHHSRLIFDCRICGNFEKAKEGDEWDNTVYKSDHKQGDGNFSQVFKFDKDILKDPTLQRRNDVQCPKCKNMQAVTFTQPTKDRLNLIFVCTKCANNWKKETLDPKTDFVGDDGIESD